MKWPKISGWSVGLALTLTLLALQVARADNCSSLSDCYNSADGAASGAAGAGAAGLGYYYYKKRKKRKKLDPCGSIREEMASIVDAMGRLAKDKQDFQQEYQSERETLKTKLADVQKNYDDTVSEFERNEKEMAAKLGDAFATFYEKTGDFMKSSADDEPSGGGDAPGIDTKGWIEMYENFKKYKENVALEERYKELRGMEDDLSKQIQELNGQLEAAEKDYKSGLDQFNKQEAELKSKYDAATRSLAECEKASRAPA